MVMSWVFVLLLAVSIFFSLLTGQGEALGTAVLQGAQSGVTLTLSIAGSICLWCGVSALMGKIGASDSLARLFRPLLRRLFPSYDRDPDFARSISANVCANLLGLGNAATPTGIQAAQRLARTSPGVASNELCRLIVLNTASIQLIPANVAAIRSSLGAGQPFDILPAVWGTSLCSASLGLLMAWFLGKVWKS